MVRAEDAIDIYQRLLESNIRVWLAGVAVRCLSAEMQVRAHTGYDLPPEQGRDLALLRKRLGV